jgi:type II secretory pathway pseudopilin PulG
MVATTILSMLFFLAVPTYQRLQRKARAGAIVNDLRVFAAAFQAHAHEAGSWPADVAAGVVPPGMTAEELKSVDWVRPTPIGGKYNWEYDQLQGGGIRYRAAIAITGTADALLLIDADQFLEIDRVIDDGDLATGSFRLGFGDAPLFVIEP